MFRWLKAKSEHLQKRNLAGEQKVVGYELVVPQKDSFYSRVDPILTPAKRES